MLKLTHPPKFLTIECIKENTPIHTPGAPLKQVLLWFVDRLLFTANHFVLGLFLYLLNTHVKILYYFS